MKELHICKSCGKVIKEIEDFAGGKVGSEYCSQCTDEFGYIRRYSYVIEEIKQKLMKHMSLS